MECIAQKLGAINTQRLRPLLGFSRLGIGNPKTQHRHTRMLTRMTEAFSFKPRASGA